MTWYLPFKISIAKTDVFAIECLDQLGTNVASLLCFSIDVLCSGYIERPSSQVLVIVVNIIESRTSSYPENQHIRESLFS